MKLIDRDVPGPRRDLVGYGPRPPRVVWPDGAAVALNFVVNYEEGSEYSKPAGDERNEGQGEFDYVMDPRYRDLGVESTYEYGSRAGIWRLLRLFDEYRVKTTFFACGAALERNPAFGRWLAQAGHEPCSHGWRWSEPWLFQSRADEQQHMRWAIESIERACGERPQGWFCRYSGSPHTRELLVEEGGFVYDADAYNDDLPYFTEVLGRSHLVVPYSLTYNDGRILAQGYGGLGDFFEYCKRGLDELRREGQAGYPKMMSVGLHPRWMGQAGRTSILRELIEYALSLGDVWITRRIDIANWWLEHHETFER
ncbi:MAG: polysaccharide deacetylase family protein [Actinomycetia bacterium]|nr:polysaccharide deacetylase family protein [Actinomycetes bacterium]